MGQVKEHTTNTNTNRNSTGTIDSAHTVTAAQKISARAVAALKIIQHHHCMLINPRHLHHRRNENELNEK
jgi:hypothetical protein